MSQSVLLSPIEAAEFLGVQPNWLEKRRGAKALSGGPPFVRMGGFVRYRKDDLEEFVKNMPVAGGELADGSA